MILWSADNEPFAHPVFSYEELHAEYYVPVHLRCLPSRQSQETFPKKSYMLWTIFSKETLLKCLERAESALVLARAHLINLSNNNWSRVQRPMIFLVPSWQQYSFINILFLSVVHDVSLY